MRKKLKKIQKKNGLGPEYQQKKSLKGNEALQLITNRKTAERQCV